MRIGFCDLLLASLRAQVGAAQSSPGRVTRWPRDIHVHVLSRTTCRLQAGSIDEVWTRRRDRLHRTYKPDARAGVALRRP